jgi:hypothetical protein
MSALLLNSSDGQESQTLTGASSRTFSSSSSNVLEANGAIPNSVS